MSDRTKQNLLAAIEVDPTASRLGLRSTVGEAVAGKPILYHTVSRLLKVPGIDSVVLVTTSEGASEVKALLEGLPVQIFPCDEPDLPARCRLRRARLWALGSWRGGLANTYFACEAGRPQALAALCKKKRAEFLLLAPAEAPLLCPGLVEELLRSHRRDGSGKQLLLSTAPPGLSADLYGRKMLEILAASGRSIDAVLDFRPDRPEHYVDGFGFFHWYSTSLTGCRVRLCADTDRSLRRVAEIVRRLGSAYPEATAEQILALLREDPLLAAGDFPQEMCVEITSRRSLAGPLDGLSPPEADMPVSVFEALLSECSTRNDVRLTLGIQGEPFLHPQVKEVLNAVAQQRPCAFHVHTAGLALNDELTGALLASAPDVVSVRVDACSAETYRLLHGVDAFERVTEQVEHLAEALLPQGRFVVPEFALCPENASEAEAFFDRWYSRTGWVVVRDHNDLAGQRPSHSAGEHVPPERTLCGHVAEELAAIPPGVFVRCVQDLWARDPLGEVGRTSIQRIWQERPLKGPLCDRCRAWAFSM